MLPTRMFERLFEEFFGPCKLRLALMPQDVALDAQQLGDAPELFSLSAKLQGFVNRA